MRNMNKRQVKKELLMSLRQCMLEVLAWDEGLHGDEGMTEDQWNRALMEFYEEINRRCD
jgi:hypothetical protein